MELHLEHRINQLLDRLNDASLTERELKELKKQLQVLQSMQS